VPSSTRAVAVDRDAPGGLSLRAADPASHAAMDKAVVHLA
jgi:hypothetical protein